MTTDQDRMREIGRALMARYQVDVFVTLGVGLKEIDGVPVETYGRRSGMERRLKKLEKAGRMGWVLPSVVDKGGGEGMVTDETRGS
jgi:hypothetical protein